MIEYKQVNQPTAFGYSDQNGNRTHESYYVLWSELEKSKPGDRWCYSYGGSHFSGSQESIVVHKDEERAVVVHRHEYSDCNSDEVRITEEMVCYTLKS